MNGLLLHCGASKVDFDDVLGVETPEATDTHFPIPHGRLVREFQDQLDGLGLAVTSAAHALSNNGQTYFGMFEVVSRMPSAPDGASGRWNSVIGLRNDHGKRFAAGAVGGERVFVCDNLCFSGEFKFSRKHTTHIMRDLPKMVSDAVSRIWNARQDRIAQIERWRETCITDTFADHLILESFRRKVFPAARLETVVREFREPSHTEHLGEGGARTLWTLNNAVTEALKGTSLRELPGRTMRLQPVLDSAADVVYN